MTTRPLLCLVTDRRRLTAVLGRPLADWRALVVEQLAGAAAGGIDYLQIREPDLEAGELLRLTSAALSVVKGTSARVLVNDRADVAMAAGAHGVHLREASVAAAAVRNLRSDWLVGRSVHSTQAAASAGAVDYVIAGTVFQSASKPGRSAALGPTGLAAIVRAARGTPVLAIGGVTVESASHLAATGAAGIAAIGAFIPEGAARDLAASVEELVQNYRLTFDSGWSVP